MDETYIGLGQRTSKVLSRNAYGAPLEVLDINGVMTLYGYTPFGTRYFEASDTGAYIESLAAPCSSTYACPEGAIFLTYSRSAGGAQSRGYFDQLGRSVRKSTLGFDGVHWSQVDSEYDDMGRTKFTSVPYFDNELPDWNEVSYDILGRVVETYAPAEWKFKDL